MFIGIVTRYKIENIESIDNLFVHVNYNFFKKLSLIKLIPLIVTFENYELILPLCSGFILTGGSDINPYYYNETNNGYCKLNDIDDTIDIKIINYAITNKIPLLGICRGHQIINVYFGGNLLQDINNHNEIHKVYYKNRTLTVNSSHHQAIDNLGFNLIPLFKYQNITEAFIHKTLPIIGIQWHPERMDDLSSSFIFKFFKKLVLNFIN